MICGRSASFPFLMLFLLSDNFGRRAAEERSHAEHGNEDKKEKGPHFLIENLNEAGVNAILRQLFGGN